MTNNEKFNAILNNCRNPQGVKAALLALEDAGFFKKERKEADVA